MSTCRSQHAHAIHYGVYWVGVVEGLSGGGLSARADDAVSKTSVQSAVTVLGTSTTRVVHGRAREMKGHEAHADESAQVVADRVGDLRANLPANSTLLLYCRTPQTADPDAAQAVAVIRQTVAERLRRTLTPDPGGTKHSQVAATIVAFGARIDLIEATTFAAQLLRGHPVYSTLLFSRGDDLFFCAPELDLEALQCVIGAPYMKACAHQAAGLTRPLLDGAMTDPAVAAARWQKVVALLLCPNSKASRHQVQGSILDLLRAATSAPLEVSTEHAHQWRQLCESAVMRARDAERDTPSSFRDEAINILEAWLGALPLPDPSTAPPLAPPPAACAPPATLDELLGNLGRPKPNEQVISAVRSGSAMYGLSLPTSDSDYHLVYLAPPSELLSLRQSIELRRLYFSRSVGAPYGAAKDGLLEYTAVELSHYLQTLTKGNPSALELLFVADDAAIARAWPWDELAQMRGLFLTAKAFDQYCGFVKVHIKRAQGYVDTLAEGDGGGADVADGAPLQLPSDVASAVSKALYHTYHKLFEAARIVNGDEPHVLLRGDEHAFVRSIRTQPLVGDLDPRILLRDAEDKLSALWTARAARSTPLPGPPDMAALHEWLLSVRLRALARDGATPMTVPVPLPPSRSASSGSSASAAAASSVEAVGGVDFTRVCEAIAQLEAAEGVRVLWAVERSSRAFGTHRADSDFDVLAVFALNAESLLSLHPPRRSLVFKLGDATDATATAEEERATMPKHAPSAEDIERRAPITIMAHEARHACTLLAQTNPTMFEAIHSPIIYRDHEALSRARALLCETADVAALHTAYGKLARQDYSKYVLHRGGTKAERGSERRVLGKKYAHVLRELLTADWLTRRLRTASDVVDVSADGSPTLDGGPSAPLPPVNLAQLAAPSWVHPTAREAVETLHASRELLGTPRPPLAALEAWVAERLQEVDACTFSVESGDGGSADAPKRWNAFCIELLRGELCAQLVPPRAATALPTLDEIGLRYTAAPTRGASGGKRGYFGGDKTSAGQGFTAFYDGLLAPLRTRPHVHFLEVGVWFGKSLAMWSDYFDDTSAGGTATIHGVDIHLKRFNEHRTELSEQGAFRRNTVCTYEYDTSSDAFGRFVADTLPSLDVVLDDGCHTPASQWGCFRHLWPKVRGGGTYIVEDIESAGTFFEMMSDPSSGFGALIAAVANENALTAAAIAQGREACVGRVERAVASARERAVKGLETLHAKAGAASAEAWIAEAIRRKEAEIVACDADKARAIGEARAAFDTTLGEVKRWCVEVASVEVRRMNVVLSKRL